MSSHHRPRPPGGSAQSPPVGGCGSTGVPWSVTRLKMITPSAVAITTSTAATIIHSTDDAPRSRSDRARSSRTDNHRASQPDGVDGDRCMTVRLSSTTSQSLHSFIPTNGGLEAGSGVGLSAYDLPRRSYADSSLVAGDVARGQPVGWK
jgi:hypothetical protein